MPGRIKTYWMRQWRQSRIGKLDGTKMDFEENSRWNWKPQKIQLEIYGRVIQRVDQIEERVFKVEDKIKLEDTSKEYEKN